MPMSACEPASLTKLMTCYVVFHALKAGTLKLTDPVTISEHAWRAEGSRTFVQVGSRCPAEVLIKGMIVQSGNDATIALAERVGGTEPAFVQLMNEYAQASGHDQHALRRQHRPALADPLHAPRTIWRCWRALWCATIREYYYVVLDPRVRLEQHPARKTATACSDAIQRSMA